MEIFPAEIFMILTASGKITPEIKVLQGRDQVTEMAMQKFRAWQSRNVSRGLEIIDIDVQNCSRMADYRAMLSCFVVVKFRGNAIP
jgi:hypothetical protein